jgi:hypothetical protein
MHPRWGSTLVRLLPEQRRPQSKVSPRAAVQGRAYRLRSARLQTASISAMARSLPTIHDVSTAYATTGTQHRGYIPGSPAMVARRRANHFRWLIGTDLAQRFVNGIERISGPSAARRAPDVCVGRQPMPVARTHRSHQDSKRLQLDGDGLVGCRGAPIGTTPGGAYTPAKLVGPDPSRACRALVLFRWPEPTS